MMNVPLLIPNMIERAETYFPKKEVVSRTSSGIQRFTYAQIGERTRRLSHALQKLGVEKGDRVATFGWNDNRHLEAYFAIPGLGAVLHTINIRLSPEHIIYIVDHAKDKVLLIDETLLPLIEKVKDELNSVQAFIVMSDNGLPETSLPNAYSYEQLLEEADPSFQFRKDIDENANAGLCYTSATTGKPKGVMYSHRGIVLHSFALGLADTAALSEGDRMLPVVPMFHANAWGLPFAAVWYGTSQVLPGPQFTPKLLAELIQDEKVTITAGVPTIWLGLLKEMETGNYDTSSLRAVLCGGSAAPPSMIEAFERKYNVPFLHAYGMTETSPLVSVSTLKSYQDSLTSDEKMEIRSKQGLVVPGLEISVVGVNGEVEKNGEEMGELRIRGPWIADEYYNDERSKEPLKTAGFIQGM